MQDFEILKIISRLILQARKSETNLDEIIAEVKRSYYSAEAEIPFRDRATEFVRYQMYPMSKVGYKSKRLDRLIDVLCIFQELRKDTSDEQSIDMEKLKLGIMEKCQIKKKTAEAAIQLSRRRLIDYINLNEVKFKMAISERASVEEVLEFAVIHIERMQEREFQKKS